MGIPSIFFTDVWVDDTLFQTGSRIDPGVEQTEATNPNSVRRLQLWPIKIEAYPSVLSYSYLIRALAMQLEQRGSRL